MSRDPVASARRAVATAERRFAEQEDLVRIEQLNVGAARNVLDVRILLGRRATLDAAKMELDIRSRVLEKARIHLAEVVRHQDAVGPKSTLGAVFRKCGEGPPQSRKSIQQREEPMSQNTKKAIADIVAEASLTTAEREMANKMPPEARDRFIKLRLHARRATK